MLDHRMSLFRKDQCINQHDSSVRILFYFDGSRFPHPRNRRRRSETPIWNRVGERRHKDTISVPKTYGSFSSAVSLFLPVGVFDSLVRFSGFVLLASSNQIEYKVLLIIYFSRQSIQYYSEMDQVQRSVYSWSECWPTPDVPLHPRLSR